MDGAKAHGTFRAALLNAEVIFEITGRETNAKEERMDA